MGQPSVEIRLTQGMRLIDLISILFSMYPRLAVGPPAAPSPVGLAAHLEMILDGRPAGLESLAGDHSHLSIRTRKA